MSTERIVVLDSVADAFVARFREKVRTLGAGDPVLGHMPLGALVTAESARRVRLLIDDAIAKGAVLLAGGDSHDAFMDATVLDHVTRPMRLYREESFGPVAVIIRVADAEEAITVADEPQMPFGGVKASGYGKFGGTAALDEFTELRWITLSTAPGDYPI